MEKKPLNTISNRERIFHTALSILLLSLLVLLNIWIVLIENRISVATIAISGVVIPFLFIWIIKSFQGSQLSRNFTLLFVVSIFGVIFIEKVLEYIDYIPSIENRLVQDTYNKISALNNELDNGFNAHIRIPGNLRQHHDNLFLSDIADEVTIFGEEDDDMIIFRSDENGFRNSHGSYDNFDVLLLGDSFTESSFVPENKTIHHNLIQNDYKTYNAGVGGSGLAHSLATFIEYGIPKEPKFVILNIVEGSSIFRMHRELKNSKFMEYYKTHESKELLSKKTIQNKTLRDNFNKELIKSYSTLLRESAIGYKKINQGGGGVLMNYFPQIIRTFELLKGTLGLVVTYKGEGVPICSDIEKSRLRLGNILKFFQEKTNSFGGHFIVGYFGANRYATTKWEGCEYKMVKLLLNDLEIPIIDMVKEFDKSSNPSMYFAKNFYRKDINGHYNSMGYKVVSDKITRYLNSISLVEK